MLSPHKDPQTFQLTISHLIGQVPVMMMVVMVMMVVELLALILSVSSF